jgi:hypothetical protein
MTTDATPSKECSSAANRMRRHRQRRREGLRHFGIDLREREIDVARKIRPVASGVANGSIGRCERAPRVSRSNASRAAVTRNGHASQGPWASSVVERSSGEMKHRLVERTYSIDVGELNREGAFSGRPMRFPFQGLTTGRSRSRLADRVGRKFAQRKSFG